MRLQVVAFTIKDWMQFAALLAAETALIWLAANVLFKPLDVTGRGLSVLAVVVLFAGASVTPRLLHDYGIWGTSFKVAMVVAIAATTLFAIKQTAYPHEQWLSSDWLLDSARSLAIRPHDGNVPV